MFRQATLALVLLAVLSTAAGEDAASGSGSSAADSSYFGFHQRRGFFPENKTPEACIHGSTGPLCGALLHLANNSSALAEAAALLDVDELLAQAAAMPEQVEDAHSLLALASCRIGYNRLAANPSDTSPTHIPAGLAQPLLKLSKFLRREPGIGYAGLVLDNCLPRDEEHEDRADDAAASHHEHHRHAPYAHKNNWYIQRTITSRELDGNAAFEAEVGFYAGHCEVEEAFVKTKNLLMDTNKLAEEVLGHHSNPNLNRRFTRQLQHTANSIRQLVPALKKMRTFIHPSEFFTTMRPFLECGKPHAHGVVFEGPEGESVDIDLIDMVRHVQFNNAVYLRGPTGAMTSTLPFVDAALGITSKLGVLGPTMKEFRRYQPIEHSEGVEREFSTSKIREAASKCLEHKDTDPSCMAIIEAYDDTVIATAEFRMSHVDHVMTYIVQTAPPEVSIRKISGTGGTTLSSYLCRAAMGTLGAVLVPDSLFNGVVSLPAVCVGQCFLEDAKPLHETCPHLGATLQRLQLHLTPRDDSPRHDEF
eukprot:m.106754 g.106754  ORF g.106754 m.106754 type:complete len:533 (-) comp9193_c0_seq1:222-1820(-)